LGSLAGGEEPLALEEGVVLEGPGDELSLLHWPMIIRPTKTMMKASTTLAQPDVRTCFAPHLGQASALVLISVPHSLHFVIAILRFPLYRMRRDSIMA